MFSRLLLLVAALSGTLWAGEVSYANASLELPAGARLPGMGNVSLGMPGDASFLLANPAALAELQRPEGFFHHANLYQDISVSQDEIFGILPLGNGVVAGFGGQRIDVGSILKVGDSVTPDFSNPSTFSAADWNLAGSISRSLYDGRLLVGGVGRLSIRDMDQVGLGAQLDGSVIWKPVEGLRVGTRLERLIATATVWESGRREWTPMDVALGVGYDAPVEYLYGRGSIAFETPGLSRDDAKSTFTTKSARFWEDPSLFLRTCRLGGEFRFNWGGVIRAGMELQSLVRWRNFFDGKDDAGLTGDSRGEVGFGVGYVWRERLKLDYALQNNPDLGVSHRIAVAWMFGNPPSRAVQADSLVVPVHEHSSDTAVDTLEAPEHENTERLQGDSGTVLKPPTVPAVDSMTVPVPAPAASPESAPAVPAAPAPAKFE